MLATFAFALSYDALRQMAVAIHIRGLLTYAFPLVIDGFIAIGVGALLMLRTAPLHARAYVWALVGAATTTSIWANALHAVRLNQQTHQGSSFRLDDLTVGILSAIAPLALAGAVHLYLVIRRHPGSAADQPAATSSHVHRADATTRHIHATQPPELTHTPRPTDAGPVDVAPDATTPRAAQPTGHTASVRPTRVDEELLAIARHAPPGRGGRASRRQIEAEIRNHGHPSARTEPVATPIRLDPQHPSPPSSTQGRVSSLQRVETTSLPTRTCPDQARNEWDDTRRLTEKNSCTTPTPLSPPPASRR